SKRSPPPRRRSLWVSRLTGSKRKRRDGGSSMRRRWSMTGLNPGRLIVAALMLLPSGCTQAAPFFTTAAEDVTRYIQKTYYDPQTGLYAHSLDDRSAEATWGNGVMFSALVAAARHEPRVYRPILSRFFESLEPYWDKQAKIPGYEP